MGIELQGVPYGAHPGDDVVFQFKEPVMAYALGIWAFTLTFGDGQDHWVQDVSIRMLAGQQGASASGAAAGTVVTATVDATLQDAAGHSISSESIIYPVCLAVTGTADSGSQFMTNVAGVANGGSVPLELQTSNEFTILASCLSGFALQYASGDNNQMRTATAGCGITRNGEQGQIDGTADLVDGKGHHVVIATVDAGAFGTTYTSPGFAVQQRITKQTESPVAVTFPSMTTISSAMVFLQEWQVQFDRTCNLQAIEAGSFGPPQISGNTVTLPNLRARAWDKANHFQDDSASSATVMVVALP